ncbi:TVP38/TMEM64 family protein [Gloeothece verrucosa]|uniref:TVP38/TMEM64 family membrane protein n=1 Tax=Gloeothece verrucosa (strain PCC 7822) TaxID=497965 RepID=E0U5T2_GLOV7|nr:TVP38/TMEM64 family protein [Gloeothece verrucosa]ADN15923.1 SNARE associated Golgi protein-related protein [Gloeothece verrucosa PCC 7822]
MTKAKTTIILLTLICLAATAIGIYLLGGLAPEQIQAWLKKMGIWAPIIYIILYTLGTILILPSTPLNLSGGALFGVWWGTLWTTLAAIVAAVVSFAFTRTIGRDYIANKLAGRWEAIDAEMRQGGLFYMFAIRLLPIIPYGIVNFAAGLTSIRFRDYLLGTSLGTLPGILPFVMMGAGLQALSKGNIFPLTLAFTLTGMLVGVATWYRRRRQLPPQILKEIHKEPQKNKDL